MRCPLRVAAGLPGIDRLDDGVYRVFDRFEQIKIDFQRCAATQDINVQNETVMTTAPAHHAFEPHHRAARDTAAPSFDREGIELKLRAVLDGMPNLRKFVLKLGLKANRQYLEDSPGIERAVPIDCRSVEEYVAGKERHARCEFPPAGDGDPVDERKKVFELARREILRDGLFLPRLRAEHHPSAF
jgi:hypothetical protein